MHNTFSSEEEKIPHKTGHFQKWSHITPNQKQSSDEWLILAKISNTHNYFVGPHRSSKPVFAFGARQIGVSILL